MPYFSPKKEDKLFGFYNFFDGDFISQSEVQIPYQGLEESRCLEEVRRLGADLCYIVAVYGIGSIDFSVIDRELRSSDIVGYIGMTSCPGIGFDKFYDLTGKMALVYAFIIRNNYFERHSFQFLSENELSSMGFDIHDLE